MEAARSWLSLLISHTLEEFADNGPELSVLSICVRVWGIVYDLVELLDQRVHEYVIGEEVLIHVHSFGLLAAVAHSILLDVKEKHLVYKAWLCIMVVTAHPRCLG